MTEEDICVIVGCINPKITYTRGARHVDNPIRIKWCKKHWSENVSSSKSRGKRYYDKNGYVLVYSSDKLGERVRIGEHRAVMQQKLGRKLEKYESVHHINGIRDDNRPENLELWVGGIRYGQRATDVVCPHCNKAYISPSEA